MKLTPCKLQEMVREEAAKLAEENPYTGWENLPPGWDEESLESFAQNLTGQEGEEGFFTACMDEVEDKFDEPEAFCASLKDQYLGREDWRGPDENLNQNTSQMKLTENKLRQIVREEISLLRENRVKLSNLEDKHDRLAVISPKSYPTAYDRIEKYLEREGYETRMFDFYVVDDPRKSIEDMKIWQGSGAVDGRTAMSKHVMQLQESNGVTDYYAQFQQYLSSVGTALRGGYGEFEYKGYRVVTSDGDFFLTVSLFRDKYDEEPAAKARIEDGGVRYKKPAGVTGRPQIRKEMYRSPEQVMKDLVEMAEN